MGTIKTLKDDKGRTLNVWAPTGGATLSGSYTSDKDRIVKFGSAVKVTIGGKKVPYVEGYEFGLTCGVTFIFETSVDVHTM